MAMHFSPDIVSNGLVFNYDDNSVRSYTGPPIQNLAQIINPNGVTDTNIQYTTGYEEVTIPTLGKIPSVAFVDGYNSNSASYCCMQQFYFTTGNSWIACSSSTTYTYSIVYKVTSGYTHPNFMYRYEYTAGGAYVGEAGIHDDAKRVHLGNGWYWAWNTFTTGATTTQIALRSFYYQYNVSDRFSMARVLVTPGDYTGLHPRLWPALGTTKSSTQAIVDPVSRNTITISNLTYANTGAISFNGSNNYMDATGPSFVSGYSQYSICYWARRTTNNRMPVAAASGTSFYWYGDNSWFYTHGGATGEYYYPKSVTIADNTWGFFCCTYDGANVKIYRNGVYEGQQATTGSANWSVGMRIGYWNGGAGYQWSGDIDSVTMYNRAITAAEVTQNFNARRGLYGI